MASTTAAFQAHFHSRPEDCHHKEVSNLDGVMNVLEKISAIALGVFSALLNFELFLPFFFTGVLIGIYSYVQDKATCNHTPATSSCAHGLLEQLTGVKLPQPVSLMANIAATVCHIEHHATVFVPIIGVSLGAWAGKTASYYGELAKRRFN